jgi:phosphohistidine phosphatase SixA
MTDQSERPRRSAGRRGTRRGLLALLAACLVAFSVAPARADGADDGALVERLRAGGLVIYLRHADTTGEPRDRVFDLADRSGQRNLSARGREQSAAIGAAFRRLGIPVGEVRASPVFRARDTAEIAFGADAVRVDPDLVADDYAPDRYPALAQELRRRFGLPPARGNTVLVGHIVPLSMALGTRLTNATWPEGSAAVFEPVPGGGFRHLGMLVAGWERAGG